MGTRQDINNIYRKYYNKDILNSTLAGLVKKGKIKSSYVLQGKRKIRDYDLDSFEEYIQTDSYKNKILAGKRTIRASSGKIVEDLTGETFGYLTVLGVHYEENNKNKKVLKWKCKCICGNICYVLPGNLKNHRTKSCGCYKKEKKSKRHYWQ